MKAFFRKEVEDMPVTIMGKKMKFSLLETEDPALISSLRACASARIGGVVEITEVEYQERLKKKSLKTQSQQPKQREEFQKMPRQRFFNPEKRNAAFADAEGEYVPINPSAVIDAMPTVGKVKF